MKKTLVKALSMVLVISGFSMLAGIADESKCSTPKKVTQESSLPKITRADLSAKLGKVTLVDALGEKSFERSRIKGSVNIPYETVDQNASKLLPNKDADIVVYCMNTKCHASDKVADDLAKIGYKHVSIYREGLQDWVTAGLPAEGSNPSDPMPPQKTANKAGK